MLRVLRRIDRDGFVANHRVSVGNDLFIVDFFHPVSRTAIECHSYKWHIGKHNADARRDRMIRSAGIEIIYFTWDDVVLAERATEEEIRNLIARRMGITNLF